ncbi:PD-(D/E)XK nuclease-like domain-containing protein [Lentzea sp. NPDC102401]|uniref:PD-(D/E)XK nuclease-like domain-containing protein n=1 Tax=Lentzea sp. NPDC102401 TaxID=3364128 RepID=UPI003825D0E9
MTDDGRTAITKPGVYDLAEDVYHSDPVPGGSLSASGAKLILDCPARFRYAVDHRAAEHKKVFDFGSAAHKYVLGTGPELAVVDARDWRTKAAQEAKKLAREQGKVPLLAHDHEAVQAMARKIAEHPIAGQLFAAGQGQAEQSLFWFDERYGVWRRARLDWLPNEISSSGRLIIPDYKTTVSVDQESIAKAIHNLRYPMQADWYCDAVQALGIAEHPVFLFVFQEKTPPYLVQVVELDGLFRRIGREDNRLALEVFAECQATGEWPGYSNDIELIEPPAWAAKNLTKETVW